MKAILLYTFILFFSFLPVKKSNAQDKINEIETLKKDINAQHSEIEQLKYKLTNTPFALKQDLSKYASAGMVLFLFGAFCALWAQNTNRNPWIWFFAGVIFSVLTVLIVLSDNNRDIRNSRQ